MTTPAHPSRRDLLGGLAAGLAATGLGRTSRADDPPTPTGSRPPAALIVRESDPTNLESPPEALASGVTPTEAFYVRNHFAVPNVADPASWMVEVAGAVREPLTLGLDDLRRLPTISRPALLECAGNGRVFLVPKARGLLWGKGAVGVAEWGGVPLAAILDRAGVEPGAAEVILEGADSGALTDPMQTPGVIPYARSLPLAKARADVLLAWEMNGRPLTPEHGFPVRAIVPGWYGMASVKWLRRVVVAREPFRGYFQTLEYSTFVRRDGLKSLQPLTQNAVNSQVLAPGRGEAVAGGAEYRVRGRAWAGEAEVVAVEFSADGGRSWANAELVGEAVPFTWRLWECSWHAPRQGGECRLLARARDDRGRVQPLERDPDLRSYAIHHAIPTVVTVRPAGA